MCEYCEDIYEMRSRLIPYETIPTTRPLASYNDFYDSKVMWIDEDIIKADNSANEYEMIEVKINYCPMCGRKLVE